MPINLKRDFASRLDARSFAAPIAACVLATGFTPLALARAGQDPTPPVSAAGETAERSASPSPAFTVHITDSGKTTDLTTSAPTVADLLKEAGVKLNPLDRTSAPLSAPVKNNLTVAVTRVRAETVTVRTPYAYGTKRTYSSGLRVGSKVVKQAGKAGGRTVVFRDLYRDGVRTERTKIADKTVKPQTQVEVLGTRGMTLASRGFFGGRRIVEMRATGYGPSGNGSWGMRTSSGLRPGFGVVAVDPRFIPLGTRLYIEGYGHAVAGDTGGAIKGDRIDLGYDSDGEASRVGRKRVRVLILD